MWKELHLTITVLCGKGTGETCQDCHFQGRISFLLKSGMPLQPAPRLVSQELRDVPRVVLCPGGTKTLELSQVGHENALEQLQIKYSAFGALRKAFLRPNSEMVLKC